jgi:hypothetical protein
VSRWPSVLIASKTSVLVRWRRGCRAVPSAFVWGGVVRLRARIQPPVSAFMLGRDFSFNVLIVLRVVRERKKLRRERQSTRSELSALRQVYEKTHSDILATFAKLERLERQEEFLEERGHELARRGFESLEEMERADRQQPEIDANVPPDNDFGAIDWDAMGALDGFVIPSLGVADDIGATTGGSASGV